MPEYSVTLFAGLGSLDVTLLRGTRLTANASNCRSFGSIKEIPLSVPEDPSLLEIRDKGAVCGVPHSS